MDLSFTNKVVLVTGASRGIGQAIALRLAKEGADILIDDRPGNAGAAETKTQIEALGRKAVVLGGDLANTSDDRRLIQQAVEALGKIDVLINNAGVAAHTDFWNVTA